MKTSGRSIWVSLTRYSSGWPVSRSMAPSRVYRVPIPMAVRPRPIMAPAVMIAPQSARMVSSPVGGWWSEAEAFEEPHPAGADQDDPGEDHEQPAAPAPGPRPVRPGRPHLAEEAP